MPKKKGKKAAKKGSDSENSDSGAEDQEPKEEKEDFKPPPRKSSDQSAGSDDEGEKEKKEEAPKEEKKESGPPKPFSVKFQPHTAFSMEAVKVIYCPTCGLPPDFCQFGPSWDMCKPWCMENFPQYYPELVGCSIEDAKKMAEEKKNADKDKLLPGGKKKRDHSPVVHIKKLNRGGRKCVTLVTGLDGFGLKLDHASKLFKKKFACGCSVVKGDPGFPDGIEIQGDFEEEVIDLVSNEYKGTVPEDKFVVDKEGTKRRTNKK